MKRFAPAVTALIAGLMFSTIAQAGDFTRECYIDIIETAVGAYAPERLENYIADVETDCSHE